jgi:hypothetical protein
MSLGDFTGVIIFTINIPSRVVGEHGLLRTRWWLRLRHRDYGGPSTHLPLRLASDNRTRQRLSRRLRTSSLSITSTRNPLYSLHTPCSTLILYPSQSFSWLPSCALPASADSTRKYPASHRCFPGLRTPSYRRHPQLNQEQSRSFPSTRLVPSSPSRRASLAITWSSTCLDLVRESLPAQPAQILSLETPE